MKERPILFSGPMVRALLTGTKTQTRRIAKPVRHPDLGNVYTAGALVLEHEPQHVIDRACPYGQPGDRLWVRETWNWFDPETIPASRVGNRAPFTGCQGERAIFWSAAYAADGNIPSPGYGKGNYWRPSIHMPRWASRITLEVTGVHLERLQDISVADALAEGVNVHPYHHGKPPTSIYSPVQAYRDLWEQINGAGSWEANPWVWAVEFKRLAA